MNQQLTLITSIIIFLFFLFPSYSEGKNSFEKKEVLEITVYKSPSCGCCKKWEEYLTRNGFKVISYNKDNMNEIKNSFGVQPHLQSCHTASINGYVIEGHVPAEDIKKLLKEPKKNTIGLTAPGMPKHSPGMQKQGKKPKGYNILSFKKDGSSQIFNKY